MSAAAPGPSKEDHASGLCAAPGAADLQQPRRSRQTRFVAALLLLLAMTGYFPLAAQSDVTKAREKDPELDRLFRAQSVLSDARAMLNSLQTALTSYSIRHGAPPTTEQGLAALTQKPSLAPVPEAYQRVMKIIPRDPWQRAYRYCSPARRSGGGYDLYSLGPDGVDGTPDDIGNWKAGAR